MIKNIISSFLLQHSNPHTKYVLGVSGGSDSMVLLAALNELRVAVIAVHFNFMLREKEADWDQALVEDFCSQHDIPFFVRKENAQEYAKKKKVGIQEAAREMRYSFFKEVMHKEGAHKIVTAHHADDQVETILFNLLRASGIKGLVGMPVAENNILRPLISVSKSEIYKYARANNIPFREDASNQSDKYQRNFLRNQVIPFLEERFPNAKTNILQSANYLRQVGTIYDIEMERIKKKLLEKIDVNNYRLYIRKLNQYKEQEAILYELFSDFGLSRTQFPELLKLLEARNGAYLSLTDYTVYRNRNFLLIQAKGTSTFTNIIIEEEAGRIQLQNGSLTWQVVNEPLESVKFDKNIATVDARNIELPLRIRQPNEGDYFYPLGMKKKKKLSRYFIDNKYSVIEKEKALVLEMAAQTGDSDKRIIWLVGERIDNRFRISKQTSSYYKFTFKPF